MLGKNSVRKADNRVRRAFQVEQLESRTLLAVNLTNGLLTVLGTEGNDNIRISHVNAAQISVLLNNESHVFAEADMTAIAISALGGNDRVRIDADVEIDATIMGGGGNDILIGGGGNDVLHGDDGNDRLYGNDGDDELHGGAGNDRLYGGEDDDHLCGDDGNDRLGGENGDDYLSGDEGVDRLEGGAGYDTAVESEGRVRQAVWIDTESSEFEVEMETSSGAWARASFELEQDLADGRYESEFEIEVAGATPNAAFDIVIGGVFLGQLVTDGNGNGILALSNEADGAGQLQMPEYMPQLGSNLILTIGAMFNAAPADWLEFEVTVEHSNGAEGSARFELLTEPGEPTEFELEIEVEGGLANASFDVAIGGWNFGQLTTDATGTGMLEFAAAGAMPPSLNPGSLAIYGALLADAIDQILGAGSI